MSHNDHLPSNRDKESANQTNTYYNDEEGVCKVKLHTISVLTKLRTISVPTTFHLTNLMQLHMYKNTKYNYTHTYNVRSKCTYRQMK